VQSASKIVVFCLFWVLLIVVTRYDLSGTDGFTFFISILSINAHSLYIDVESRYCEQCTYLVRLLDLF